MSCPSSINNDLTPLAMVAECKNWCAPHEQPWKVKCTWSKYCNGCSECHGEILSYALYLFIAMNRVTRISHSDDFSWHAHPGIATPWLIFAMSHGRKSMLFPHPNWRRGQTKSDRGGVRAHGSRAKRQECLPTIRWGKLYLLLARVQSVASGA